MQATQVRPLPPTGITAARLSDTPLPQLLAELGIELHESSITDPTFYGAFLERGDGTRVLRMPTGRSASEHDTAARMLLADGLGLSRL